MSRKWVSDFEQGRAPGAELALVLRLLDALGLVFDARPATDAREVRTGAARGEIDLDALLERYREID